MSRNFFARIFRDIRQKMGIAGLLQAMLAWEEFYIAHLFEAIQDLFRLFYGVKPVKPFCPFTYLTCCLVSAQKQDAKYSCLFVDQIVCLKKVVGVFGYTAYITLPYQFLAFKAIKGL